MMNSEFLIFTPGPVKMSQTVLDEGGKQMPYFRTTSFSNLIRDCSEMILASVNAPLHSTCLFLASSGTGAMDSAISGTYDKNDSLLIVNSGSFGQRFCDIADFYSIDYEQIKVPLGKSITIEDLEVPNYSGKTSLIINGHETSTGTLHDLKLVGNFCKKNELLFVVDGISVYLTDELDMQKQNIDILIISSQKGLALPPGLSMLVFSPKAKDKIMKTTPKSYYFNLKTYFENMERFQTPFTPPVGIMMQLMKRLEEIYRNGGVNSEIIYRSKLAKYFRERIKNLPLKLFSENPPNAITALTPTDNKSAYEIVKLFEHKYKIYICPNGGSLKDEIFRVSHMGDIDYVYTDKLIQKLINFYKY